MSETLCQLLARRRQILNNRKPPIRLEIENPYTNADGTQKKDGSGNIITSQRLAERRKAEILQYNKTSNVQGKLTRAQNYRNVVENIGRTSNVTVTNENGIPNTFSVSTCPNDLYLPTSSSAAGIPGPSFNLQYRPEVPLYGYANNAQQLGLPLIQLSDAWSFNTSTNIQSLSGEFTSLLKVFHNIDNIDNELVNKDYEFTINIPLGLYAAGDISGDIIGNDNSKSISKIDVQVLDHAGGVLTNITPTIVDHSFNDISLNYTLDNSNNFYALKHIGSLGIKLQLHIEQLAYYDIQVKFTIDKHDTNEYVYLGSTSSYVSAVYMNLTNSNLEKLDNITNVSVTKNNLAHTPEFNDFFITGSPIN